MGEKIAAFCLGLLLAQCLFFVIVFLFKRYKKLKRIPAPVEETIESYTDTVTRLLGFNPYEFPTITKLYNKLEKQKSNYPKTCPKAVHVLFDTINRNKIMGGEKTAVIFNPETLASLLNTSTTGSRREQLIRRYTKE
ncbi:hypothetical protein FDH01_gp222 [Acinetobacter phage vB_AbaM_ME3]|uniref:Putative membrane protein n=1 Tax=Acinetobacter phage vB_AbaM_ME3 TaxID=1837876 RepID=A0A172Q0L0_9CAUD|nr:hypothetical protein FDH01_gp222 [Acinetobacter phage vB_AbaM_ME3]AND75400.1 putative membrane protein [Acinetobacter phage vB_AbaM_ME3]